MARKGNKRSGVERERGSRNKLGISDLVKSEMTCVECVCWAHANFSRLRGEILVSPFSFRDIEVDVQEKPKPLKRGAEREGGSKRGNKHTKIKPTVYLKPASHLCKIATAV